MNVCVFCNLYHPSTSGVATVIDTIAQSLKDEVRFSIVPAVRSPQPPEYLRDSTEYGNRELKLFSKLMSLVLGGHFPLTSACLNRPSFYKKFDLFHCHTLWPNSIIPLLRYAKNIPCVLTPHDGLNLMHLHGWNRVSRGLIRSALLAASKVVVLSSAEKEEIENFAPEAKVEVIYNGVRIPSEVSENSTRAREKPANVIFVGKATRRKGIQDLIKAAEKIGVNFPDEVVFTLAGGMDKEFISSLSSNMRWLGVADQDQLYVLYREADLLVLPSYHEGMPMVILEAMANGLPVVATPVGGIPQMVKDQETGYLVTPGDVEGLIESIMTLVRDRKLAESLGRSGKQRCVELFSDKIMAQRHLKLYRSLVGGN